MAKHTKGPWKATRVGAFSYEIITDLPFGHTNYGVIVSEVRSQENARLIAAAPELLDALETLFDITPFPTNAKDAEMRMNIRALIAKAKGVSRG